MVVAGALPHQNCYWPDSLPHLNCYRRGADREDVLKGASLIRKEMPQTTGTLETRAELDLR
jgi:hypothetical protein